LWGVPSAIAPLKDFFAPGVISRGEGYRDRVDVESRADEQLVARVRGTAPYRVVLRLDGGRVSGACSCPYASGSEPCKHLWATLRVAEKLRWFRTEPPRSFRVDSNLLQRPPADVPGTAAANEVSSLQSGVAAADEAVTSVVEAAAGGTGAKSGDGAALEQDEDIEDEGPLDEDDFDADAEDFDDEEDLDDDDVVELGSNIISAPRLRPVPGVAVQRALLPTWQHALQQAVIEETRVGVAPAPRTRLHYLLVPDELKNGLLYVHFGLPRQEADHPLPRHVRDKGGGPGPSPLVPEGFTLFVLPNERARRLQSDSAPVERWLAALSHSGPHTYTGQALAVRLDGALFAGVVRELCATGRCHLAKRTPRVAPVEFFARTEPLRWDEDDVPWRLEFELRPDTESDAREAGELAASDGREPEPAGDVPLEIVGSFVKGELRRPLSDAEVLVGSGLVFWPNLAARFEAQGALPLALGLRHGARPLTVRREEVEEFVRRYQSLHAPPALVLPAEFELSPLRLELQPRLELHRPVPGKAGVPATVTFEYGERSVPLEAPGTRVLDWPKRQLVLRDEAGERRALEQLAALGLRLRKGSPGSDQRDFFSVASRRIPSVVRALLEQGWTIEAEGRPYRKPGRFALSVTTGVDWLELSAELEFGGDAIPLPALLAALKKGETSLILDDGSVGILPEEWLARWGVLTRLGQEGGETLRFRRSELPLLAALVEQAPEYDADAAFHHLRQELERGRLPHDGDPPAALAGELRPYQRDGLAFLRFLERARFGGCLADDMGLGKTVQLLSHLATPRPGNKPALVVAPRSVLFNWEREASRFTPSLRVLTHFGPDRTPPGPHFQEYDLVLTTYALLRLDREALVEQNFGFVVLDEAQAIKNAESHTARAARALKAEHRLALSGTPIENHIGELWSLFEFLNPGLLRHSKKLEQALTKARSFDAASAALVARAVRPFLLRRTKTEVLPDLPERTEQTLYVELSPEERRSYDELSVYYRAVIRDKIETVGLTRATPQVLEALLRLRQAACHPGLLDETRAGEGSAKFELLLARLAEVVEGGHKALVFSQFTSLLALLRAELDQRGVVYEYLDGRTLRREEHVDRFQNDPAVSLFLISLKAGGVGLNLTAADYVFLLDPWWNPAAEAQAIDRAHRIGQTRHVVAYRLITRDTVEEKVEALQGKKRELVAAVLSDGQSLGSGLSREDLEALLE
jgi:hypothetical protein